MKRLVQRLSDLILSVYAYNEYQGYTQLNRFIDALERWFPEERRLIEGVKKHARDERKHYALFCHYFRSLNRMPFDVGRAVGHFDWIARVLVGRWAWELQLEDVYRDREKFAKICRAIIVTEARGLVTVKALRRSFLVRNNRLLERVFAIIEKDEPSHFLPYEKWLRSRGLALPGLVEKSLDRFIHTMISIVVLPALFLNVFLARRSNFLEDTNLNPLLSQV